MTPEFLAALSVEELEILSNEVSWYVGLYEDKNPLRHNILMKQYNMIEAELQARM